jgi:ribonuclease Z
MSIRLTILGTSAALPTYGRKLSAHLLEINGHSLLFDCGEGTQFQLRKYKKNLNKISTILISHLHGDHFFGLPGLLSSMQMMDRNNSINIFGPKGIKEAVLSMLLTSRSEYSFQINFHIINTNTKIELLSYSNYKIFTFPLKHNIETYGYLFKENTPLLNIKKDFIKEYDISIDEIKAVKQGADFIDKNKKVHNNKDITETPKDGFSYAYCSDTGFKKEISEWIKGVSILYHETTYLEIDSENAKSRLHSTAKQAAQIAKLANAKTLLLGHYSGRYSELDNFKTEAQEVFQNVIIGREGMEMGGEGYKIED